MTRYLVVSDTHLGHRRTPTDHILENLRRYILSDTNGELDVIFVAGDLFDRLLDFNSKDVHEIVVFLNDILEYCSARSIKLRILEGTPSHDWKQSEILVKLNSSLKEPCDLRYINKLDIEIIDDLNLSVLYIPDEWNDSHDKIYKECLDKLKENNLEQVDIGIFHGQFYYQLKGPVGKSAVLIEQDFLSIVKYYINIGHYHTHSYYDRIIAQGSFDRLCHGEEEPKGFAIMEIGDNPKWEFVTNENAFKYVTFNIRENTKLETLDKKIFKLPPDSYIRFALKPEHSFNAIFNDIQARYINYRVSRKHPKKKDDVAVVDEVVNDSLDSFCLNPDNIYTKLVTEIERKDYEFSDGHWEKLKRFMEITPDESSP